MNATRSKSFLFGSMLGINGGFMLLVGGVATVTFVAFAAMLRPLIISTCDPVFFETRTRRPWLIEQGVRLRLMLCLPAAFETLGV